LAGSIALVGFGLDSAVESLSGGVLIWRLKHHGRVTPEEEVVVERSAVRLVGISFFLLAAYVAFESARKLYLAERPEPTLFGIAIALLSLMVMPALALAKHRTALRIGSRSLRADSRQTLVCSLLSAALLVGLGLNYLRGLWWADPAAALVICVFIVREGIETLREERLCSC
ncbi:MAG: cation diffusion facilitator family transporter, partial [Thermodesulfobacteriota bacterium]